MTTNRDGERWEENSMNHHTVMNVRPPRSLRARSISIAPSDQRNDEKRDRVLAQDESVPGRCAAFTCVAKALPS
jgi:hypothetical protein